MQYETTLGILQYKSTQGNLITQCNKVSKATSTLKHQRYIFYLRLVNLSKLEIWKLPWMLLSTSTKGNFRPRQLLPFQVALGSFNLLSYCRIGASYFLCLVVFIFFACYSIFQVALGGSCLGVFQFGCELFYMLCCLGRFLKCEFLQMLQGSYGNVLLYCLMKLP